MVSSFTGPADTRISSIGGGVLESEPHGGTNRLLQVLPKVPTILQLCVVYSSRQPEMVSRTWEWVPEKISQRLGCLSSSHHFKSRHKILLSISLSVQQPRQTHSLTRNQRVSKTNYLQCIEKRSGFNYSETHSCEGRVYARAGQAGA